MSAPDEDPEKSDIDEGQEQKSVDNEQAEVDEQSKEDLYTEDSSEVRKESVDDRSEKETIEESEDSKPISRLKESLTTEEDQQSKLSSTEPVVNEVLPTDHAGSKVGRNESQVTTGTESDDAEDVPTLGDVVYEWEEELDEYDEPDIYPSEKDYKWVSEMVEEVDEEEELPAVTVPTEEEPRTPAESQDVPQDVEQIVSLEADKKEKESDVGSETGEAHGALGAAEVTDQDKEEETIKKKMKVILVKKLIPRPPKIHYVPVDERLTHSTDNKAAFSTAPFHLEYSFGYDSQRMANLHVLDDSTLVYMSGFVLSFFNHQTMKKSYLRCLGGSCFGALAIHPSKKLFAAAEKGLNPLIGIWSWPKLQLFRKLKEGTHKIYASANFSPDGKHIASQGGEPDYLITVWNWLAEMPLLRVKSHAQDVFRVTFSKELAGRLTTSGLCHIKFWKMANTFTGLKLKGDIGRFGRTELSDIEGYVEMPDGKVLSGSEWGNLLVWEDGLIVAELCIKNDIPCHDGIVRQVLLNEGEFYTTGQDGMVKTWSFDAVDTAEINTTEDSQKVSTKVLAQVNIGEGADIWSIVQDVPTSQSNSIYWFAQDGRGTIWKADLSFLNTAKEPMVISTAHGGPILDCKCSAMSCLFATLGVDGQVRVYNYITKELVARATFSAPGSCLVWPSVIDSAGTTIITGFTDGTFRVLSLSGSPCDTLPLSINLELARKPHSRKLTTLEVDSDGEFLVTGSQDGTIFFFDVRKDFQPMAFVQMPDWKEVRIVSWSKTTSDRKAVFVALDGGTVQEVMAPKWEEIDNEMSYFHVGGKLLRRYDFLSIKSQLRHNEELQRERIAEEARQAALEEANRQRIVDGAETQSQQDLRLLQEADELERVKVEDKPKKKWEPFIPSEPSPIYLMIPCPFQNSEIILSMGKYDAGYMYLAKLIDSEDNPAMNCRPREPISAIPVPDSDDVPITAYAINVEGDIVIWGFEDGRIRVQKLSFPFDLENVGAHWTEGVHDCVRGSVTSIALEKQGIFMITCGNDGNCFLHSLVSRAELEDYMSKCPAPFIPVKEPRTNVQDILSPNAYTLEVSKSIEKEMALLAAAKRNKAAKHEEIVRLRLMYYDIVRRNSELPEHSRLTDVEFIITKDGAVRREKEMQQALKQLHIELAWETERCTIVLNKLKTFYNDPVDCNYFVVKGFSSNLSVCSFRIPTFPPFFELAKDKIMNQSTPRGVESSIMDEDVSCTSSTIYEHEQKPKRKHGMDKFVYQRLVRLWERKQKKIQRRHVWREFLSTEPKGKELREEDRAIDEANMTIGDMKLKMAADYKVPDRKKLTEHRGRKRLVYMEEIVYELKSDFNNSLLNQREFKLQLIERFKNYKKIIVEHQDILPREEILPIPEIEALSSDENPKSYMEYTQEDVKAYKHQLEERAKIAATQMAAPKPKKVETPVKRKHHGAQIYRKVSSTSKVNYQERNVDDEKPKEEGSDLGNYVDTITCEPSALEKHIMHVKLQVSRHYQDYYLKKINQDIFIFNSQIQLLKHRKVKLDYLTKTADQKLAVLIQEFMLAQKSEAMEAAMETKIVDANRERKEYAAQIKALSKKQEIVKKDMDGHFKQKSILLQEVLQISSKVPAFEKYLIRVFNKKINKPKVKEEGVKSSESVESSGSEDNSDSSSDMDMELDEDDDDGLDIDFPPPELNKDIYDQVVDVRNGRLVIDESELAAKEVYDELAGNISALKAKTSAADKEFERGRRELEAFTKEKQQFLNDIDVAVSLNLHQILHMDKNMSETLVTENSSISRLRQRIPELLREKRIQRKKVLEVRKTHLQLQREKQRFLERLFEMDKKCNVEMLKKFGVVTDIEILENFCIDPEIVALQKELETTETQNALELSQLQFQQDKATEKRMRDIQQQSSKYFTMTELIKQIVKMTQIMDEDMKRLPSEYEDNIIRSEAIYLRKLVMEQWNVLKSLNKEIISLTRRKVEPLPPIRTHRD